MLPHRSSADRLIERVATRCARALDPLELLEQVAGLVRAEVPYAASGWALVDPDTLLMTGVFTEGVDHALHRDLIACELTEEDVNKFWQLAQDGVAAVALSEATGGDLARSTRWARSYAPRGFGDEVRTVFATSRVAWGHACLTRRAGDPFFSTTEVALLAAIAPHLGNGIRTCHLLDGLGSGQPADAPALIVLDDDGAVVSQTPQAREWVGPPEEVDVTIVLHEVAHQARALADQAPSAVAETADRHRPAMARVRSRHGDWLVVRGARLAAPAEPGQSGRTALVLEPARRTDLAPLLLCLHQLTDREREVTQLLLVGMSTHQIADRLWITPETLRGHVKSIYAKLGVASRPELAALLAGEPRSRERPAGPGGRHSR